MIKEEVPSRRRVPAACHNKKVKVQEVHRQKVHFHCLDKEHYAPHIVERIVWVHR